MVVGITVYPSKRKHGVLVKHRSHPSMETRHQLLRNIDKVVAACNWNELILIAANVIRITFH